jgi:hypothetical protein
MASPFPHILILSDQRYAIDDEYPFNVFQAESFTQFVNDLKIREDTVKEVNNSKGIRIKIG